MNSNDDLRSTEERLQKLRIGEPSAKLRAKVLSIPDGSRGQVKFSTPLIALFALAAAALAGVLYLTFRPDNDSVKKKNTTTTEPGARFATQPQNGQKPEPPKQDPVKEENTKPVLWTPKAGMKIGVNYSGKSAYKPFEDEESARNKNFPNAEWRGSFYDKIKSFRDDGKTSKWTRRFHQECHEKTDQPRIVMARLTKDPPPPPPKMEYAGKSFTFVNGKTDARDGQKVWHYLVDCNEYRLLQLALPKTELRDGLQWKPDKKEMLQYMQMHTYHGTKDDSYRVEPGDQFQLRANCLIKEGKTFITILMAYDSVHIATKKSYTSQATLQLTLDKDRRLIQLNRMLVGPETVTVTSVRNKEQVQILKRSLVEKRDYYPLEK